MKQTLTMGFVALSLIGSNVLATDTTGVDCNLYTQLCADIENNPGRYQNPHSLTYTFDDGQTIDQWSGGTPSWETGGFRVAPSRIKVAGIGYARQSGWNGRGETIQVFNDQRVGSLDDKSNWVAGTAKYVAPGATIYTYGETVSDQSWADIRVEAHVNDYARRATLFGVFQSEANIKRWANNSLRAQHEYTGATNSLQVIPTGDYGRKGAAPVLRSNTINSCDRVNGNLTVADCGIANNNYDKETHIYVGAYDLGARRLWRHSLTAGDAKDHFVVAAPMATTKCSVGNDVAGGGSYAVLFTTNRGSHACNSRYDVSTSYSAGRVAGLAALVQHKFNTSTANTKQIILQTATDLGAPGVDEVYGHGLINAASALQPLGSLR